MATTTSKNSNISGSPVQLRMGGKDYMLHPLDDRDYGEFENWMRAQPIEIARENMARVKGLTQAEQDRLLDKAMEISASLHLGSLKAAEYMNSVKGAGYMVWLGLKKHVGQERMTHEDVVRLLMDDRTIQEAMDKFDMVNGIPKLKSSKKGGQQKISKIVKEAAISAIGKPFGDVSTDTSQKNSDGTQTPSPG